MTRPADEVRLVQLLAAQGLNKCAISRETGIPRSTLGNWLDGRTPNRDRGAACIRCSSSSIVFRDFTASAYAYLLGLYLGDGCLAAYPRGVFRLGIYLDRAYPRIVAECEAAMSLVMPSSRVSVYQSQRDRMAAAAHPVHRTPH